MEDNVPNFKKLLDAQDRSTPIWEKKNLSVEEASKYFGIGPPKIREMLSRKECPFCISIDHRNYVVRVKMEQYLDSQFKI